MTRNSITDLPLGRGFVFGLVAYVAGYVITYVWKGVHIWTILSRVSHGEETFAAHLQDQGAVLPQWQAAGWLFYNAHFVVVEIPRTEAQANLLLEAGGDARLLFLVPPLVLVVAGALVRALDDRSVANGWLLGATIAVGYFPTLVLGSFVFSGQYVDPDLVNEATPFHAVFLCGLYPVAFGGIGGGLANLRIVRERISSLTTR